MTSTNSSNQLWADQTTMYPISSSIINPPGTLYLKPGDHIVNIDGIIVPSTTNIYDVGTSSLKWKDIYISGSIKLGNSNTATITINPSTSYTLTIPDVGTSSFVMTAGVQTIGGTKTFTGSTAVNNLFSANFHLFPSVGTNVVPPDHAQISRYNIDGNVYFDQGTGNTQGFIFRNNDGANTLFRIEQTGITMPSMALTNTSNQLTLGEFDLATISITPTADYTLTIPDTTVNAAFIMSETNQTVNGTKAFTSRLSINASAVSNNYSLRLGGVVNGAKSQLIRYDDINGINTWTQEIDSGGHMSFNETTIPTQNVLHLTKNGVGILQNSLNVEAFEVTGSALVTGSFKSTATSNQAIFGATNKATITITPTSSYTLTIPNVGASSFMMTEGNQTVNGVNTFISGIVLATTAGTPSNFNYYEEASHSSTFTATGFTTASISFTITRVGRHVTLQTNASIQGSTTGVTNINSNTDLSARFSPSTGDISFVIPGVSGGTNQAILLTIQTNGNILLRTIAITGFPSGSTAGSYPFSVTYNVA